MSGGPCCLRFNCRRCGLQRSPEAGFEMHSGADRDFDRFLQVQLLWDEYMAESAAAYLAPSQPQARCTGRIRPCRRRHGHTPEGATQVPVPYGPDQCGSRLGTESQTPITCCSLR